MPLSIIINKFKNKIFVRAEDVCATCRLAKVKLRSWINAILTDEQFRDRESAPANPFAIIDAAIYKHPDIIERFLQRIKSYRHIAARYNKLSFLFFPPFTFNL